MASQRAGSTAVLQASLRELAHAAGSLAQALPPPLVDSTGSSKASLPNGATADGLRIALLAIDEKAFAPAASWLTGASHERLATLIGPFARITIASDRRVLVTEDLDAHASDSSGVVQLLLAKGCQPLLDHPDIYQRFRRHGELLILAASAEASFDTGSQLDLFYELTAQFPILWPIAVDGGETSIGIWKRGWHPPANQIELTTTSLDSHADIGRDSAMHALHHTLLPALRVCDEHEALRRRLSGYSAQCEAHRAMLLEQQSSAGLRKRSEGRFSPRNVKKSFGAISEFLSEQFGEIEVQLVSQSDQSTQALGDLSAFMHDVAAELEIDELERSSLTTGERLSLGAVHLARINRQVAAEIHNRVRRDVADTAGAVDRCAAEIGARIQALDPTADTPKYPALREEPIWYSVCNMLQVGREAHIDLPRKGVFDILSAGRQKVFVLLMMIGLAGRLGFGPEILQTLGIAQYSTYITWSFTTMLLIVLVVSVINASISFVQEKVHRSQTEFLRIRESLFEDGLRVLDKVQRTKVAALREYLKTVSRKLEKYVDEQHEELTERLRTEADDEKERTDSARKQLELEIKQIENTGRSFAKLQETCSARRGELDSLLREACGSFSAVLAQAKPVAPAPPIASPGPPSIEPTIARSDAAPSDVEPTFPTAPAAPLEIEPQALTVVAPPEPGDEPHPEADGQPRKQATGRFSSKLRKRSQAGQQ